VRTLFLGSPEFAVPALHAIHGSRHELALVVTQPPRPAGRGRRLRPTAVAEAGRALGLNVAEPVRLDEAVVAQFRALAPAALCVVAYGKLLRPEVLELAEHGAINVHPSSLPRFRGASPIQAAVLAGDETTGVTTMRLDEGLDTGDILLQESTLIGAEEDAVQLAERLADLGAALLVRTLDGLDNGTVEPRPQDDEGATYAPKLEPDHAWIDWSQSAEMVARRVRGLVPWPVAQARLADGRRLKILVARPVSDPGAGPAGSVSASRDGGFEVACGEGSLVVLRAQVEGRAAADARDLVNGRQVRAGSRLG